MSNMLKNSKIGYQYLIENILDVVAELDLDGTVIYVSPQFYDIFGYNPEEIIGNEFFKFIHPDYSSILKEQLKRGSKGKEELYVEFKVQHKSGNYIAASAKGTFI